MDEREVLWTETARQDLEQIIAFIGIKGVASDFGQSFCYVVSAENVTGPTCLPP